jgi:hypothetical protein
METVVIQVRAPRGADPGRVIEGHYNIVGDTVILVDQSGKPLTSEDQKFSRKLNAGDNAKQIAAQLLRLHHRAARAVRSEATGVLFRCLGGTPTDLL